MVSLWVVLFFILVLGAFLIACILDNSPATKFDNAAPRINTEVVVASVNNYVGWEKFIDINGKGYNAFPRDILFLSYPIMQTGHVYNITYYCDYDGYREVTDAKDITPTPYKCQNINGMCQ